jgi:hypothetical protein
MSAPYEGESSDPHVPGLKGVSHAANGGVFGKNDWAATGQPPGAGGNGGWFESLNGEGVRGWSKNLSHGGVVGVNTGGGIGVFGLSDTAGRGVEGSSKDGQAVYGHSVNQAGVVGESDNFDGVYGISHKPDKAGISGFNSNSNGLAGFFFGNVVVTGDVKLANADCAENFDIGAELSVEPGTVMVLGEEGALFPSLLAYDKRVAGVISGAGEYKPGIVLDNRETSVKRQPVALLGKVYCKVDAAFDAIEVGDLLTTSPTPGHAMKAADHAKAFGSVIGKALRSFSRGRGLIPILIALQ